MGVVADAIRSVFVSLRYGKAETWSGRAGLLAYLQTLGARVSIYCMHTYGDPRHATPRLFAACGTCNPPQPSMYHQIDFFSSIFLV